MRSDLYEGSYPQINTLVNILVYRAFYQPESIAYTFLLDGETKKVSLTYQELDQKARAIAVELQRLKVTPGERALLLYPSGLEFIVAFFGCLYAGVVAVPVYPPRRNQRMNRLQAIVKDSEAKFALTTASILTNIEQGFSQEPELTALHCLATDKILDYEAANWQKPNLDKDTLAFLQYTSGSTGRPKGVMVSHGNLLHNQSMLQAAMGHTEKTIYVVWLPLFHDMGLIGNVLQSLYLGVPCIVMSPTDFIKKPFLWLQTISRYQATTSGAPNFAYDLCIDKITPEQRATLDLSSWDVAFNGAEPIRSQTLERFTQTFAPCGFRKEAFYPCYGMAEATLLVCGGLKTEPPVISYFDATALEENLVVPRTVEQKGSRALVGCGRIWLDSEIAIADPVTLKRCPDNQIGEIWVSGGSVTQGYWRRPEQTEETFHAYLKDASPNSSRQFLRTGDLGFIQDGELFVTGRLKDVIIIRGRNHYPQDIELTVEQSHQALKSGAGAAFGVEIDGQEQLVIVQEVERTYLRNLDVDRVVEAIQTAVSQFHELQVHRVLLLKTGTIPKTSSGKIQRHACRAGFLAGTLNAVNTINTADKEINPQPQRKEVSKKIEAQVRQGSLLQWLSEVIIQDIANSLGKQPNQISLDRSFHSFGIDSLKAVEMMETLGEKFGFSISPTLLFEYPTPTEFALHLIEVQKKQLEKYLLLNWEPAKLWARKAEGREQEAEGILTPSSTLQLSNPSGARVVELTNDRIRAEDIAVIGMSGRFPQSPNLQSFWQLLSEGKNTITEVPSLRWNLEDWYDKNPDAPNKTYSRWGGFIEHIDQFDPLFFQISPREAELMDPQQRLFLEVAWEALEDSGYSPESFAQTQVGVFVGCSNNGYYQRIAPALNPSDYSAGIGNQNAMIANRVSFLLNLRGPSILVDTMCSSSLVALHMACRSLHQGECTTALAGGVNLLLSPEYYVGMSRMKMHSPNGRCASFDRQADGIVLGEGAGAILLKPLSLALKDGDRIYAVIKGSAVNHDGRTNGITAPNPRSHAEVICQALDAAGISADTISYVEAHGTGTSLGDPIEVEGLTKAFRKYTQRQQFCKIGSVKTNIGHLECAAGIAQVIKVILGIQHRQIPPNLHFQQPNPLIPFAETPFEVNTKLCHWESAGLRRAGINSFGIGGTNAHIVIEEAPQLQLLTPEIERPKHLLTLSAKTEKALIQLISRYETHLAAHPDLDLGDICFTANTGRSHFQHRASAIATSTSDLHQQLVNFRTQQEVTSPKIGSIQEATRSKIAFLFTGQGSQYADMGRHLYETQPTFRKILDHCNEILLPYLPEPLLKVLYPQPGEISPIDQTMYTQPALFSLEYALVQLWKSWGVEPSVVMGHGIGEYVAACVAGVFSLEDGLKLIAKRARLMQSLPQPGEMVAVFASEAAIRAITEINFAQIGMAEPAIGIAAYNAPENTVISGEQQVIRQICGNLEAAGIQTTKLTTSHAFHSPLMKPILAEFRQIAATVTYHAPQIDIISNVTGEQLITVNPEYWCNHLISSVQFAKGLQGLYTEGYEIFLEIGPKPTLSGMGSKCLGSQGGWLPSLNQRRGDWQQILESLAELYVRGVQVQWSGFDHDYSRRRVQLPTYPFQRKSYWIEAPVSTKNHQSETTISAPSKALQPQLSATSGNGEQVATLNNNQVGTQISIASKAIQPRINRLDTIVAQFHSRMVNLLKADPSEVNIHTPFLELGADSLMLGDTKNYIDTTYGIKITISQLFEELTTIYAVASYIEQNLPPEPPQPTVVDSQNTSQVIVESDGQSQNQQRTPAREARVTVAQTTVERIMLQQLQTMSQLMSEQLDVLRATGLPTENIFSSANVNSHPASPAPVVPLAVPQNQVVQNTSATINQLQSHQTIAKSISPVQLPPTEINLQQQQHLKELIANHTQKTQTSKQSAQSDNSLLADSRAVAGFRPSTKEMLYPREGKLPLCLSQQGLWFNEQLEQNSAFYSVPVALRLQGQLNAAVLEQSFQEIIRRHEALRTNFITLDGQPYQVIHPDLDWQISVVDLQHLSVSERESEAQKIAIAAAQRPFNLETEPLVRATLLVLSPTEYILQLTIHHIVSDGWSMNILIEELTVLYTALIQGQPSPLASLPIQYVDFALWQRQWLQGEVLQSQLAYWKQQLSGAATILSLPTDRPRPTMQTVRGAHQSFALSLELTDGLKALSKKAGVTLFMTMLAAFDILLYRYTGQTDILVGSPNASRDRPEIQGLIGYFVNTLLLRADMSGNPSLQEFLQQVRKTALGAYAHQDVPVEELIVALQPVRDLSYTPLFQVMFALNTVTPLSEMQLPGLTWSRMVIENYTSPFDLTLTLENTAEGLVGSWEYNSDLFDAATITRMMGHFQTLLEGIVAHPEQRIGELPMLTAPERQQLLFEWNDTHTEYPQHQCIHELFESQVERTPDAVAVVFAQQQLTYRQLNSRANQLAHYLRSLGVQKEVLVGLCLERSLEQLVSILAILKAGGGYVPLDPDYPQQRLSYLLADAQVKIVLTQQSLLVILPTDLEQVICWDTDAQKIVQQAVTTLNNVAAPENVAAVFYTSGSTGTPKGVVMTHQGLVNYG
ncbi:type I polyketide synthase, partial [aff. Roholtiella sp. LEGE 12411]|uniref:type I polyketide synthase n=1 Tax=aff. Roholtiella sp. LEGE 12411 TaxID=1828822 RepID=UPI00188055D5